MTPLKDMPIRRKLTLSIVLTCAAALLLACGAFVAYDVSNYRQEMVEKVESLAGVTGNNTTAALEFNDAKSAADTLSSLRSERNIVAAFVYDRTGAVFASYRRPEGPALEAPPRRPETVHEFTQAHLRLFQAIVNQGETIGAIALVSDLTQLSARIARYLLIVALVFGVSLLLAALLSRYFERLLTRPILHLAALTRTVAEGKNYASRATRQSDDEIGQLVEGFNHMLAQIQARDAELQQAHALLEKRVAERTAALKEAQEEAARQHARFKLIFDSLPVGISLTVVRSDVQVLRLINDAHLRICGLTREQDREPGIYRRISHPADYERQIPLLRQVAEGSMSEFSLEKRYLTPDGRIAWVVHTVQRRRDGDGNYEDLATVVDITERKAAETERENLHRQLLDASHQAGMAEVATGVLHNVGNVLNSVNISATLIADQLRRSPLEHLARVCALLREHEAELATFLLHDPRGRQVLAFLETLAGQLAAERTNLGAEIDSLRRHIEHIKDIVAMQQGYASIRGVVETVSVPDLVEDAVRINAGALLRHGVGLQRDFQVRPTITVEKNKVLQILVNFIRNALDACIDSNRADKLIAIRLTGGGDRITIAVIDNGVGIAAGNLSRIFHHGFTTRADGHGFGLHSAAVTAKGLGGAISVTSDGPGRGAAFFLELPLHPDPLPP